MFTPKNLSLIHIFFRRQLADEVDDEEEDLSDEEEVVVEQVDAHPELSLIHISFASRNDSHRSCPGIK